MEVWMWQFAIFLPVNLSCTYVAVTLHKTELFGTAEHTDVARPSMRIKLVHTVLKVVIHKGSESVCADTVTPNIGFANVNADGTINALTVLDLANLFVVLVNGVGAYPSNVSAVPFDFKLPPANIIGKIFHRLIVFTPRFALGFLVRFDRLPRCIGI